MKIISFNANGIRAAGRKGFFEWFKAQRADVLCVQETKAKREQLDDPLYHPAGYHTYFFDAVKPGYSGVALYCKQEPENVSTGLGFDLADTEGRYIQADFAKLSVASLYLPSGSSGDARQTLKYEFLDNYAKILQQQSQLSRELIVCGDFNIVHKEMDIKNWKSNQKNSGCLPEERAWLDKLFGEMAYVDAFREVEKRPEQYTWWSNRGRARENNVGWRIDYQITTPGLRDKIKKASVYKDKWFSDHAPLILTYDELD